MRVLIGGETSGAVSGAFRDKGHDAFSCDYLPTESWSEFHILGNFLSQEVVKRGWDFGGFHPDCTFLTVSGNRWFDDWRVEARLAALHTVRAIWALPIPKMYIENPVGVLSTFWRRPDQIINPWQFGHGETKKTCLWLRGLPKLTPTNIVAGREGRIWKMPPSQNRGKERSRTYEGIAAAMAEQWGRL